MLWANDGALSRSFDVEEGFDVEVDIGGSRGRIGVEEEVGREGEYG